MHKGVVFLGVGDSGLTANELTICVVNTKNCPLDCTDFSELRTVTTKGGRVDLILEFQTDLDINIDDLILWKLLVNDCMWISEYETTNHYDEDEMNNLKSFCGVFKQNRRTMWKPESRELTGLSPSEYSTILFHYPKLIKKYPIIK